jgi:hypothetical protein
VNDEKNNIRADVEASSTIEAELEKMQELLGLAFQWEADFSAQRATSLASHFESLDEFFTVKPEEITKIRSITGRRMRALTEEQINGFLRLQESGLLSREKTVEENLVTLQTRHFVRKQIKMVESLTLEHLLPNPFLIQSLNLKTPQEVVELNVYMRVTRSIVTSMGFFIEDLVIASSATAKRVPGRVWDVCKTIEDGRRAWIQVKSGPNDMDKDQIQHWRAFIEEKIAEEDDAYIGIAYGKRDTPSVTLAILKMYLPDWEKRTLIGRELWDFVSEDEKYLEKLFPALAEAAAQVLGTASIEEKIRACVARLTEEFCQRFGNEADAVKKYLAYIF